MNQYLTYSDEDLMTAFTDMMDYSCKPTDEMVEAINLRGGMDYWLKRTRQINMENEEIKRLGMEVYALCRKDVAIENIKTILKSDLMTKENLEKLIEVKYTNAKLLNRERTVDAKTVLGSLAGIIYGSIAGCLFWILATYLLGQWNLYLVIPVYWICYFVIWIITKQSRRNPAVFIAACIATVLAILLGIYFAGILL